MTSRRQILQSAAITGIAATLATPALATPAIKLRLLETSDIHTFDEDYDYFRDMPDETVGLTKVATLIQAARAEVKNTLLFDNGDIIQGNPLADFVALPGNFPDDRTHPTIRAMNLLGYDAATVGNHEFNYGLPFLDASLAGAKFPFCCANILHEDGTNYFKPYLILDRTVADEDGQPHKLKIGVIGFVTPQIVDWDKAHLEGRVRTTDIVDAANLYVPELRKQADLVIALSHSGIGTTPRRGGEENASFYLASVPGIDVIFTGHSHRVFPGPDYAGLENVDAVRGTLNGVPTIMPGFWGSHLGMIDLTLAPGEQGWKIVDFICTNRPIASREGAQVTSLVSDDAAVNSALAPDHNKTLAWIRQPIGTLNRPVNSFFAMIGDDASLAIVNAAQTWYARPLLANTAAAALPLLSAAAPFKEGYQSPDNYVDLQAGTIAIKNVADLYMYPNTVCAVQVNGAELREWLEHSAEVFNRIDLNNPEPQPLLNPHVPSYVFDVISGITYQIDISAPARYGVHGKFNPNARRIVNMRYQGIPVTDDQKFVVVTNNYRADSGGIVPKNHPEAVVLRAPDQTRDVIVRYILQNKVLDVAVPPVWSFAALGAPVTVTFKSAPAAAKYLLADAHISRLADNDDGYAVFALRLT
ncbi:MAG: 2',3'-cyclic-nucleotide 2'-phosphodiesterase [Acidocella sp. 20-57-95]|nr:MAG: 2',3'-cyclic-nucleotide 2'-phosphodiesterase [Acidocella sp. 20-57-95]OYV59629.1 MAG: 2',3'-cyclic-nucleotide 2'-phosphodiesterase [Acidocella sp. 21-58-7]HQT64675.1 bifunctional 2',3'-cyclic-nucleotide 2'-phosphodiesterase/3'-nucleotidase [Acidocella sp.]HQU04860.1 bifunctional 2',3'-cyclic-nucleotide 2'-phosphodiesterase/3'-nucleotidase [Acidocella sp.]